MEKRLVVFLLAVMLFSCSSDKDSGIDCMLYDPYFPTLYIKLVDAEGNNLIENGTYDIEGMSFENGLSYRVNPASEIEPVGSKIREFDNTVELGIPNRTNFTYVIKLSEEEDITLDFTAELIESVCDIEFTLPKEVVYGDQLLELREVIPLQFLVEVKI
ncbi:hypothetical protein [Aestuariibaculum suncheonense]|uniref:Uncharacterized protein n=1 Tax=Aestuariibaculum suncheonense TaxID=1028745 RepID=A0A8J6QJB8_9FLAO|nr:hypothetical protein [Aestuariibaculum suncheonense]MBD0836292.1 hypothetical protein [Aestuariibaculum suncheonense]